MKVIYCVPPMKDYKKGYPTLGNNRQIQFFTDPTFVYPIIPAMAMTMLKSKGHEVLWLDAIAEGLDEKQFATIILQQRPDYMIFESPTPVVKRYYEIIDGLKTYCGFSKIILAGEHVTALPDEAQKACRPDYIVRGGKWFYEAFKIINKKEWEGGLPMIDRHLSRWWLYGYKNGNYKYLPGTHIMSAMDCWYRQCSFCSWAQYHKDYYVRPVEEVLTEIEALICAGFKEIFDDSGTMPAGEWLRELCAKIKERGYDRYVSFGCNMRFGALLDTDFRLLSEAGFRLILWGMESVNQKTLDFLNKGIGVKNISHDLILAKQAGLDSHLTVMFGFPTETYEETKRTYDMVRYWLKNDYAYSAQASICIPYPGTPLFKYCKDRGLLLTEDWDRYDMSQAVMATPFDEAELPNFMKGIYNISYHPKFIWNKIKKIRSIDDFKYYCRIGRKIIDRFGNIYSYGKNTLDWKG